MIFSKKNEERKEERKMVLSLSLHTHTHTNKQTNTTFTRSLVKTHILRCENVEEGAFSSGKKEKREIHSFFKIIQNIFIFQISI